MLNDYNLDISRYIYPIIWQAEMKVYLKELGV